MKDKEYAFRLLDSLLENGESARQELIRSTEGIYKNLNVVLQHLINQKMVKTRKILGEEGKPPTICTITNKGKARHETLKEWIDKTNELMGEEL